MSTESLIRVTVCVSRKDTFTEDEFHDYWVNQHGPLATDWLVRCGIIKYVQYHTPSKFKVWGKKMSDATGRPMLQYDGMGDFWVHKYEDFEAAFLDPEYQAKIRPDELKFIDMESLQVTIGREYIVIEDGKLVQTHVGEY